MTLVPWESTPEPFGNATGLDRVSTDVKRVIAERMGAMVTVGRFADDLQAEQEARRERGEHSEGEDAPLATITVSWDRGLVVSGEWSCGNRSVSGYRSSYWLDRMDEHTVVFDLRPMTWESAKSFAIRGPMHNPALPDGTVSKITIPALMESVADDYLRHVGASLAETGTPVE